VALERIPAKMPKPRTEYRIVLSGSQRLMVMKALAMALEDGRHSREFIKHSPEEWTSLIGVFGNAQSNLRKGSIQNAKFIKSPDRPAVDQSTPFSPVLRAATARND
jgi:hypothetical protein